MRVSTFQTQRPTPAEGDASSRVQTRQKRGRNEKKKGSQERLQWGSFKREVMGDKSFNSATAANEEEVRKTRVGGEKNSEEEGRGRGKEGAVHCGVRHNANSAV